MIDLPTYVLHRSYESALLGAKVETLQSRATRELLRLVARSIHDNFFFFRFYFYCIIKLWYIFHRGLSEAGLLPLCPMVEACVRQSPDSGTEKRMLTTDPARRSMPWSRGLLLPFVGLPRFPRSCAGRLGEGEVVRLFLSFLHFCVKLCQDVCIYFYYDGSNFVCFACPFYSLCAIFCSLMSHAICRPRNFRSWGHLVVGVRSKEKVATLGEKRLDRRVGA
jgi:hypothetical protein